VLQCYALLLACLRFLHTVKHFRIVIVSRYFVWYRIVSNRVPYGCIVPSLESIPILVPINGIKQKCFQITGLKRCYNINEYWVLLTCFWAIANCMLYVTALENVSFSCWSQNWWWDITAAENMMYMYVYPYRDWTLSCAKLVTAIIK